MANFLNLVTTKRNVKLKTYDSNSELSVIKGIFDSVYVQQTSGHYESLIYETVNLLNFMATKMNVKPKKHMISIEN